MSLESSRCSVVLASAWYSCLVRWVLVGCSSLSAPPTARRRNHLLTRLFPLFCCRETEDLLASGDAYYLVFGKEGHQLLRDNRWDLQVGRRAPARAPVLPCARGAQSMCTQPRSGAIFVAPRLF